MLTYAAFNTWAAVRKKESYLKAQFHRLKARVGAMKAIVAVAASTLTATYHMLTTGTEYRDLTAAHFDRRDTGNLAKRLVKRLEALGGTVTLSALPA